MKEAIIADRRYHLNMADEVIIAREAMQASGTDSTLILVDGQESGEVLQARVQRRFAALSPFIYPYAIPRPTRPQWTVNGPL